MTTDEVRALEPAARRRLEQFRDCFKKAPVFDYLVSYSLGLMATVDKQHCGFGAFEVRTYQSLIRHWLCSRIGMYILAAETTQLRGKNPEVTFEQVAPTLGQISQRSLESDPVLLRLLATINQYHQHRNRISYESRPRRTRIQADPTANT